MGDNRRLKARKKPRQQRAKQTVEAILEAAAQVFEAQGYARGTTDRIAARAGVSVGSLYQYFPNKDAILLALAERHMEEGTALARALLATAPRDPASLEPWVRRLCQALLALHRSRPRLQGLLLEGLPAPPDTQARLEAAEEELTTQLAAILARLAPPGHLARPRATAWVLVHALEALIHDFVTHAPEDLDESLFIDELTHLALGRLGV
jgi:AcrR family transcriptional regulator